MADKTPVRVVFNSSNVATGMAEFQSGETVPVANGGTGLSSIGSAGQVIKVNAAGTGLEFGGEGDLSITNLVAPSNADLNLRTSGTGTVIVENLKIGTTGATVTTILDEDDLSTNSATALATQQSIKAYVDANTGATSLGDLTAVGSTLSSPSNADLTLQTSGSGNIVLENLSIAGDGAVVTGILDEDAMGSDSNVKLATQQSIKAYVDAQDANIASDTLTFTNKTIDANGTGNSISNIDIGNMTAAVVVTESEGIGSNDNDTTLPTSAAVKDYVDNNSGSPTSISQGNSNVTVADSGTGNVTIEVDGTDRITVTAATTTTATGHTITLGATNTTTGGAIKFLEGTDNGTNTVTLVGPASTANVTLSLPSATDTLVGKATTDTFTNKTIDVDNNTVSNIEVDNLKSGVLDTDISSVAGTDTTLASAKAIKTYVDAQVATKDNTDEITEGSTNLYFTNARADARITNALKDEDNMASDSATHVPSQQSVKAYVDAGDLSLIDEDNFSTDSASRPPSQQSVKAYVDAQDAAIASDTLTFTNKTFDAEGTGNALSNVDVANLKSGVLDTDLSSVSGSDDTLASAKAIKTYVDAQVTASDLDFATDDSTALSIDLDSETLQVSGGANITTSGSLNTITIALDTSLSGLSSVTSTALVTNNISSSDSTAVRVDDALNVDGALDVGAGFTISNGQSITSILDEDAMGSDSASALATQQSIKAYVDAQDANIASDTLTLTNKTFDVEATGNSISNIDVADLKSGVLDTDISSVAGTDTTLASAKAIKTYVDAQVATKDNTDEITEGSTNLYFTNARADARITNALLDEDNMASDSATKIPSQQSVKAYVDAQDAAIASDTLTFTNKTIDANGTGNNISNIDIGNMTAAVVVTESEGISSNDNDTTLPTSAAVRDYADTKAVLSGSTNNQVATVTGAHALAGESNLTFDGSTLAVTGAVTISGDLTVSGDTATVSTTNTAISDNIIELNTGISQSFNDAGIIIERGTTGNNAFIGWDESADKFTVGTTTATAGDKSGGISVSTGTLVANLEGNVTGNVTGNVSGSSGSTTGNAATATALATARNIAGQSFDGTAAITIASTDLSNTSAIALLTASQTLTNKTLTNPTINAFSGTGDGSITGSLSIANTTTDDSLTITTTENGSSAGPVITLKRNSSTPADADYLGQIKFKGENDADQAVNYAKITGKILDASDGTEDGIIEFSHMKAGSTVITGRWRSDSLQLLNGTTLSVNGQISGNVTGDLTGNADTATALATARNIHGVSFDGTGNIDLTEVVQDTVGAMFSSNTETGITATYQDGDGTIDLVVGTLNQDTTGTAAVATAVTVADESSDTSCNVLFTTAATGDLPPKSGTNLTFNSSSGVLTATGFAGNLTGNVTGTADVATVATTVTITDNESTNENNAIIFTAGGDTDGGNLGLESDGTCTYNPSTGKITATGFVGTLTGNVTGNVSGSSGSTTGNAATATKLATTRAIGGVNFDGTAAINLPGVNTGGNQDTSGNAATATALETARNIAGQSFDGTGNITIASTDLSNTSAIALLTSSQTMTNKTLTSPQINTKVDFLARAEARFQDASGGQYVALEAPATVSSSVTFTLPSADGTDGQFMTTDGSGALSFADAGGSNSPNSTISALPGSEGDFDLSKTNNSGDSETPFEAGGTDAFGVNLGSVFSMMDPIGSTSTTDLGSGEAYVGA